MFTLSDLDLKPETLEQVERVKTAMKHAGLEPPKAVAMMLEVIGREAEKRLEEREEFSKTFSPSLLAKYPDFIRIKPFQAGTDFEFILPAADPASKDKAEQMLDSMAYDKIISTFCDVPGIKKLRPETVQAFMKASRESGIGNAHVARPDEVMKKLASVQMEPVQKKILYTLSASPNAKNFRHITANHLYPGDLVILKVEEEERKSGQRTFVPDWTPSERHEQVADNIVEKLPEIAKMGRFEVATDHHNKSPLEMLADYYTARGKLQDAAARMQTEHGIHFAPLERMVDHVHISNERNMVLNTEDTLTKAAGMVNMMDAMVATLAAPQMFDNPKQSSANRIQVNKIGYATDKQYPFMDEKGFAVRGVQERKEAGEIQVGHFEVRLGNSYDPFGIVFMTAAAVGGMNSAKSLPPDVIQATVEQYENKQPGIKLGDIKAEEAYTRLLDDPRLDFIPDRVRRAVVEYKLSKINAGREAYRGEEKPRPVPDALPPLDNASAAPATPEAQKGQSGDRSVADS